MVSFVELSFRWTALNFVLRDGKKDVDRLKLRDGGQVGRVGGLNEVPLIQRPQPDPSTDGSHDPAPAELKLCLFDQRPVFIDEAFAPHDRLVVTAREVCAGSS